MHLGIDLGTSNSAIVGLKDGQLRLFKTAEGADVLPSAVLVDSKGRRFVGRRAQEQAALSPDSVAVGFKRLMGTSTPLKVAGGAATITPEDASAEVLRTLLSQALTEGGHDKIDGTVITIPAAFNQMQTEATLTAADAAGIGQVGLLQEPIAAAMASMAQASVRSGQFLVYDFGGGTFDAALVQSSAGVVNIIAHDGINMLGGRDFDEALLQDVVAPWLEREFTLPVEYRLDPAYQRLFKRLRLKIEQAKVELSSRAHAPVFMADDEVRLADARGVEIHIDLELSRAHLEDLVHDRVERSIELCRNLISKNGYAHEDIDRVVLIGGPSKMPYIRERVPEALGIPVDTATDPMTAVAVGAAIYAESREWSEGRRKPTRASATTVSDISAKFDYPARTADMEASLRVSTTDDPTGWIVRVTADDGWSSGDVTMERQLRISLPLGATGVHRFTATLFHPGRTAQTTPLVITRTFSSSAAAPATLTISVAVEEDAGGERRNVLSPLVVKGAPLPASGEETLRATRTIIGGEEGHIDLKVYQAEDEMTDPAAALFIGSLRIDAVRDLEPGETIRAGDDLVFKWTMDENGIFDAHPTVRRLGKTFSGERFYSPQAGHVDYASPDGELFARDALAQAEKALDEAEKTLNDVAWAEIKQLRTRAEAQSLALQNSAEADTRRQVSEEARALREAVVKLSSRPENRVRTVSADLAHVEEAFDTLFAGRDDAIGERFKALADAARRHLNEENADEARLCVNNMRAILLAELVTQPDFLIHQFTALAEDRFAAIDKELHARLIKAGEHAIRRQEWPALRRVIGELYENRLSPPAGDMIPTALVGVSKA